MQGDHLLRKRAASAKAKKGRVAVRVGLMRESTDDPSCSLSSGGAGGGGGLQRFEIPIWYLYHPLFSGLLETAREAYGYRYSSGPITLPCSVDDFLHIRGLIQRECGGGSGGSLQRRMFPQQQQNNHPLRLNPPSYLLHSCR